MAFRDKELRTPGPVLVDGRHLKRYHIDQPERPIEPEVEKAAYDHLPLLLVDIVDDGTPAAGWVVLHRGADSGAYLLAYTWVWDNAVEVRVAAAGQPALDCPDEDPAHFVEVRRPAVGCVWELAGEKAIFFVVVLGAAPSIANGVISGVDYVPPLL
ncbi:hypothetical protein ABZU25_32735, partial [Micromonospora sp. NPDC005215]|uniref:hypothetical protein n=1 Tax=Micromonospora sp. NPDC005215 TaxID=3157024 RepID=UPI0033A15610